MTKHRCPDTLEHLLSATAGGLIEALRTLPGIPRDVRAVIVIESEDPAADPRAPIVAGCSAYGFPSAGELVDTLQNTIASVRDMNALRHDWSS